MPNSSLDLHKRLFGHCADQSRPGRREAEIIGRTGQFLRSLILFDHVTIQTLAFREFPAFVNDLGLDATIAILNSKAVTLSPDYAHFGTRPVRSGETREPNHYSLLRVNSVRGPMLPKYFGELRRYLPLSTIDFERLIEAIHGALTPEPVNYGVMAEKIVHEDLRAAGPQLKLAVTAILRQRRGFAIKPEHFELKMRDEGGHYAAETNLTALCRMSDSEVDAIIEMAVPALAHVKLRIEEMQMHSSLTEFDEGDIELLDSTLRYLIDRDSPADRKGQFRRVITLLGSRKYLRRRLMQIDF